MKKLLFFILLFSASQMFTAEGDDSASAELAKLLMTLSEQPSDSGRRPALPADEPVTKRQRTDYSDNAVTGVAPIMPQLQPYSVMPTYHPGIYSSIAGIPFPLQQYQPMLPHHPGMYPGVAGYQQGMLGYQPPVPLAPVAVISTQQQITGTPQDQLIRLVPQVEASMPVAVASTLVPLEQPRVVLSGVPVFNSKNELLQWITTIDGNYFCNHKKCNGKQINVTAFQSVEIHNRDHIRKDSKEFFCELCQESFSRKSHLEKHANRLHKEQRGFNGESDAKEASSEPFVLTDSQKEKLKWVEIRDGKYFCKHQTCNGKEIVVSTPDSVLRHNRDHERKMSKKFFCDICKMNFSRKEYLDKHDQYSCKGLPVVASMPDPLTEKEEEAFQGLLGLQHFREKQPDDQNDDE